MQGVDVNRSQDGCPFLTLPKQTHYEIKGR